MLTIPLQVNAAEYDLVIVLEDENIERMKRYDPGEIVGKNLGSFARLKIRNIQIAYAAAEEVKELSNCHTLGELARVVQKLSRGFTYKPECGDNDMAYQVPGKN